MQDRLHELLSAHLDGEVTDDERAEVEALLESTPESRETLDAWETIQREIAGLPALSAPTDLRTNVLAEIGSGSNPVVRPAVIASAPPEAAPRVAAIAGLIATVACTLLVAFALGPAGDGDSSPTGDSIADREVGESSNAFAARARRGLATDRLDSDRDETERGEQLFVFKDSDLALARDFVEPVEASLANLEVGDVVPFVDRSGGKVAVVEVTVVDVERVLGEVQLLLKRNAIREIESFAEKQDVRRKEFTDLAEELRERMPAEGEADGTFAVYVSASPERIATTLDELRRSRSVVSLDAPGDDTDFAMLDRTAGTNSRGGDGAVRQPAAGVKEEPFESLTADGRSPLPSADAKPADAPGPAVPRAATVLAEGPRTILPTARPEEDAADDDKNPATVAKKVELDARDSYQVLRRYRSTEAKRQLAKLHRESEARGLVRAEELKRIRDARVTDDSVRVLILLRPASPSDR